MICKECGQGLAADAQFCQHCGSRVGTVAGNDQPSAGDRFRAAAAPRQDDDDPAEEEIWHGRYSKWAMIGPAAGAAAITVVLFILGVIVPPALVVVAGIVLVMWLGLAGLLFYRQLSVQYTLTNQRFIHRRGILWQTIDRIEVIDIDDVTYRQGPIERLVGVGTIQITSSDRTHPELSLPGIEQVGEVSGQIDDLRRQERRRRGLYIEAV